jgi:hypothetical protein
MLAYPEFVFQTTYRICRRCFRFVHHEDVADALLIYAKTCLFHRLL